MIGAAGQPGRGRARERSVVAGPRAKGRGAHRGAGGVQCRARAARRRARDHQRDPAGPRRRARLPVGCRPRRRQAARSASRHRRLRHPLARPPRPVSCTTSTSTSTGNASTFAPTPTETGRIDETIAATRAPSSRTPADSRRNQHGGHARARTTQPIVLIVPILCGDRFLGASASRTTSAKTLSQRRTSASLHRRRRLGAALENARLFDETQRLFERDRAAQRRAGDHQQRAGGARRRAQPPGHLRGRRRQDPRNLPPGRHRHQDPTILRPISSTSPMRTEGRGAGWAVSPSPLGDSGNHTARLEHARNAGHQRGHGRRDRGCTARLVLGPAVEKSSVLRAAGRRRSRARPSSTCSTNAPGECVRRSRTCGCCRRSPPV